MSTHQHTPGPWEVKNSTDVFGPLGGNDGSGQIADKNDGWHIADCSGSDSFICGELTSMTHANAKANARLIAAAPELLRDLIDLVDAVDGNYAELTEICRATIAKATGKEVAK